MSPFQQVFACEVTWFLSYLVANVLSVDVIVVVPCTIRVLIFSRNPFILFKP